LPSPHERLRARKHCREGCAAGQREKPGKVEIESLEFSALPGKALFIADVLRGMFGFIGPTENGFIQALLRRADRGVMPPRLTDEEAAAIEAEPATSKNSARSKQQWRAQLKFGALCQRFCTSEYSGFSAAKMGRTLAAPSPCSRAWPSMDHGTRASAN
jgi:hypothetical protein